MEAVNPGEQPFSTSEAILAYCLYLAGCEFCDDRTPCTNLFDAEILAKLGYRGEKLFEAANQAWQQKAKGHVQFHFKLTPRTGDLIRAYREQAAEVEKADGKASDLIAKILDLHSDSLRDEADNTETLLRISCVILKTRGEFMNLYKQMVPLLRVPVEGKEKRFDTTANGLDAKGRRISVPAHGVQKPGFKVISLNLSEEKRKRMGL